MGKVDYILPDNWGVSYRAVAQAQDGLTAHLVAQEIFKELEEPCPHEKGTLKADCRFCYQAIKSRHGVKE